MLPNPRFPADLILFTEEILNGKIHFLCSIVVVKRIFVISQHTIAAELLLQ